MRVYIYMPGHAALGYGLQPDMCKYVYKYTYINICMGAYTYVPGHAALGYGLQPDMYKYK